MNTLLEEMPALRDQIISGVMPDGDFDQPTLFEMFLLAVFHGHTAILGQLKPKLNTEMTDCLKEQLGKSGYSRYTSQSIYKKQPICMCIRNGYLDTLMWLDENGFGDLWNDNNNLLKREQLSFIISGSFVYLDTDNVLPSSIEVLKWLRTKDIVVTLSEHHSRHDASALKRAGFVDMSYIQAYSYCSGEYTVYQFSSSVSESMMAKKLEVVTGTLGRSLALVGSMDLKAAYKACDCKNSQSIRMLKRELQKIMAFLTEKTDLGVCDGDIVKDPKIMDDGEEDKEDED